MTGISIPTSQLTRYSAIVKRTQRTLEQLLGYTLETSTEIRLNNYYQETGKTQDTCPCGAVNEDSLIAPDDVVKAYRIFPYHKTDTFLMIDPAKSVSKIKLIMNNITYRTFVDGEYSLTYQNGYITSIRILECPCKCYYECNGVQLAVDADWCYESLPEDLLYVWCDMIEYYADPKKDIKSQTLGPHSYTKFNIQKPEEMSTNIEIIKKYAGPYGSARRPRLV